MWQVDWYFEPSHAWKSYTSQQKTEWICRHSSNEFQWNSNGCRAFFYCSGLMLTNMWFIKHESNIQMSKWHHLPFTAWLLSICIAGHGNNNNKNGGKNGVTIHLVPSIFANFRKSCACHNTNVQIKLYINVYVYILNWTNSETYFLHVTETISRWRNIKINDAPTKTFLVTDVNYVVPMLISVHNSR